MASGSGSSVTFPLSEASPQRQGKSGIPIKPPYLPFRRISLPTAPSVLHRTSIVSVASFDSFPEDDGSSPRRHIPVPGSGSSKGAQGQFTESPRRRTRARDSIQRPVLDNKQVAKRRKVVDEFYETEKAYVDGLELIYSHFLTPIIASLDTSEPLLNRSALTTIFSNFIDIWNLHRSFLSALTSVLEHSTTNTESLPPPRLSSVLLAHFPYLSLYTPFITAFPATISALNELTITPSAIRSNAQYNQRFATFLIGQEADPRCGKLKLRDWLLTIVQRCPRYLLLLKDLIDSTSKNDPEHSQLTAVHTLVSKITLSLNTSLHTHAQTLSLLALQRATPNLPFQLITPGRTFLRRGPLMQMERSDDPVEREFLLFSDCLIWLAASSDSSSSSWDWSWSGSGNGSSQSSHDITGRLPSSAMQTDRPPMTRTRSKSEAELETLKFECRSTCASSSQKLEGNNSKNARDEIKTVAPSPSTPSTPQRVQRPRSTAPPPPNMLRRHASSDDKWIYKGRIDLVDVEIVVGSALEDERRFEILSPEGSFALFAASGEERDEWTTEIRSAKAQLLVSLNITNPNSTLTSSSSTNHIRKVLQALPYPPSDERVATLRTSHSLDIIGAIESTTTTNIGRTQFGGDGKIKGGNKNNDGKEKIQDKVKQGRSAERRKVEHWVPAIWIPDGKTNSCMRCGRMFNWRRRRHHCRLCGRCVCAGCSGRTFFIADSNFHSDSSSKPARACDACYETVFPLINITDSTSDGNEDRVSADSTEVRKTDTITSLSHLPSWLSMPALPVHHKPQALMAIDMNSSHDRSYDADESETQKVTGEDPDKQRHPRMRMKSHQKLRSSLQIMEDFEVQGQVAKMEKATPRNEAEQGGSDGNRLKPGGVKFEDQNNFNYEVDADLDAENEDRINVLFTPIHSLASSPVSSPRKLRHEDTTRRSKRFSLPAIVLQPTNVTARTAEISPAETTISRESSIGAQLTAGGRSRRFSLVLVGRNNYYSEEGTSGAALLDEGFDLAKGVAAARLSELLGRKSPKA